MRRLALKELDIVTIVDPAISEKLTAARTAIVTVGISPSEDIILFPTVAARIDPTTLIETTLSEAIRYGSRMIGIEGVAYQRSLGHFIEKRMAEMGRWFPVRILKPDRRERKEGRIRGRLHGYFKARQVHCSAGDFQFIKELEEFPNGRTNDILDALAYAPECWEIPDALPVNDLDRKLTTLAEQDPNSARYWRSYHRKKLGDDEAEEIEFEEEEAVAGVAEFLL